MLETWTGEIVGTMHIYGITFKELADKMHITNRYLSGILNCHKRTKNIEIRVRAALMELIEEKSENAKN